MRALSQVTEGSVVASSSTSIPAERPEVLATVTERLPLTASAVRLTEVLNLSEAQRGPMWMTGPLEPGFLTRRVVVPAPRSVTFDRLNRMPSPPLIR